MKGMFIPEITVEIFRNACLESIETLMAEGEVYDIEYDPKSEEQDVPDISFGKWVPCSERMPEETGAYLCTCKDAGRLIITLIKWQPRMKSWNLAGARTYWKVIAWMPLPEPWKGEE